MTEGNRVSNMKESFNGVRPIGKPPSPSGKIKEYRDNHGCSLNEAKKVIVRKQLSERLKDSENYTHLIHNILDILDFEFGGYK